MNFVRRDFYIAFLAVVFATGVATTARADRHEEGEVVHHHEGSHAHEAAKNLEADAEDADEEAEQEAAGAVGAVGAAAAAAPEAASPAEAETDDAEETEEPVREISPDFDEVRTPDVRDPKHTPKITAPSSVKRGEWFDVTIEIGEGARHPSLVEHHVRWIGLYAGAVEIARTYLHPVISTPKVTYTIRLERDTTLVAEEAPTHTAEWQAEHAVKVVD